MLMMTPPLLRYFWFHSIYSLQSAVCKCHTPQRSRAGDKKQRSHFFVRGTTWKFCSGCDKIRNTSGHQCKVKLSGSENLVNENTYDVSSIKLVTKKFLEVSRCSRAKQRQRNVQKKVCCTCKVAFFANHRPIVVFNRSLALPSPLSITRSFIFCLNKTINIIESFAFSPG